jgi:hypothetical protein
MQLLSLRRFLRENRGLTPETYRNPEILSLFIHNFPILMRDVVLCIAENRRLDNSLSNFGLTIPYAWLPAVYLLCCRLERLAVEMMKDFPENTVPYLTNIKEKWGTLRVHCDVAASSTAPRYAESLQHFYNEIEATEAKYRHEG